MRDLALPGRVPTSAHARANPATLDRYEAEGGSHREVVIEDSGHMAFIEKPREFCAAFHAHIGRRTIGG
jgi:pimeloyl-ACP methyl ester carboxylesterase